VFKGWGTYRRFPPYVDTILSQKEEKGNIRPSHAPDKDSAFPCRLEVGSPLLRFYGETESQNLDLIKQAQDRYIENNLFKD
jgi:hypothetical protein